METLSFKKLNPDATLPSRAHPTDAGLDIYSIGEVLLEPGEGKMIETGVAAAIPAGHVGMIADRSSLGKKGIKTFGGIIDSEYRGEIKILLRNLSLDSIVLKGGDRIAQMLILPVSTPATQWVESLEDTNRGDGGFGSTGR